MRRPALATLLLLALAAPAAAGENANLAAAEVLHTAAPAIDETLKTRFPDDYATLLPQAATLAMQPGSGGTQARRLLLGAVARIKQRDGDLVIRAPDASLRPVITADRDLLTAAADGQAPLCPVLLTGQARDLPAGPVAAAFTLRTVALLTAIADARDHPITARRANPDDYRALAQAAKREGVNVGAWAVLSPNNLPGAEAAQVCAAMLSVDATVLALHDELADRMLADMAAVLARQ